MPKPLKVALITTTNPGQPGSMAAYAEMVQQALEAHDEIADVQVINLLDDAPEIPVLSAHLNQRLSQLWLLTQASQRLNRVKADVYHLLDGSFAYALAKCRCDSLVVTVHDLIPVLQAEGKFPVNPPGRLAHWLIARNLEVLQNQRYLCAVSHCTANDLQQRLNSSRHIEVVPSAAVRSGLLAEKPSQVKPWMDREINDERYLLHIGNNGFYKNRQTVARVFIELAKDYPVKLIMAGAPPDEAIQQLLKDYIQQEKIIFIPYPDDKTLAQLYEQASILLFPSYYEGFGWPPLEAMAFGCPVVCSNAGSLPEVVGDAALMAAPDDYQELSNNCRRLLDSSDFAAQQIQMGLINVRRFSKEKMADQVVSLYSRAIR